MHELASGGNECLYHTHIVEPDWFGVFAWFGLVNEAWDVLMALRREIREVRDARLFEGKNHGRVLLVE